MPVCTDKLDDPDHVKHLKSVFRVDKEGHLWFKEFGEKVPLKENCGYGTIYFEGKSYRVHRLIYAVAKGPFSGHIDHKNRVKLDNRVENLRPVCQSVNTANSTKRSDNTSGYKGVTWHKGVGKWVAQTMLKGKRIHLGVFEDKQEAALVYNYKLEELFGKDCVFNKVFEDV